MIDFFPTKDKNTWGLDLPFSYIRNGKDLWPVSPEGAQGVFDPQVDYMYMSSKEFDKILAPVLRTIYGSELKCSETECWF